MPTRSNGAVPAFWAAEHSVAVLAVLIGSGLTPLRVEDDNKQSLVHVAARCGNVAALELLFRAHAEEHKVALARLELLQQKEEGEENPPAKTKGQDLRAPARAPGGKSRGSSRHAGGVLSVADAANRRDRWSRTPVHWASVNCHADALNALIGAGASVHGVKMPLGKHRKKTHLRQQPPLHLAADPSNHRGEPGRLEALRVLLGAGADPNEQDEGGNTALHAAAGALPYELSAVEEPHTDRSYRAYDAELAARCAVACTLLLDAGASPTLVDEEGRTAAQVAMAVGNEEAARILGGVADHLWLKRKLSSETPVR